jgi:hypothetical protein
MSEYEVESTGDEHSKCGETRDVSGRGAPVGRTCDGDCDGGGCRLMVERRSDKKNQPEYILSTYP